MYLIVCVIIHYYILGVPGPDLTFDFYENLLKNTEFQTLPLGSLIQSFVWDKILDIGCSRVDSKGVVWGEESPGASDRKTGLGTVGCDCNKTFEEWLNVS